MRIPEIVPLTQELFSSLLDLEEQAANKKEEFQEALTMLNNHIAGIEKRISQERAVIHSRLTELDQEERDLQKKISEATKKKLNASLRGAPFDEEEETQQSQARIKEIPQERTAFNELLEEIRVTPEEKAIFNELYDIARDKGQQAKKAIKPRAAELQKVYEVINDQFQASIWNDGGLSFDTVLSNASNKIYKLQKGD